MPVPTRRLLLALLVCAPLAALGGMASLAAAALVLGLLAAWLVDWRLAGRDLARVRAERAVADKLSIGEWNPVRVRLDSQATRPLRAWLRDQPPAAFAAEPLPLQVPIALAAGGSTSLEYRVRPPHRGDERFGSLYLRALGPLGLAAADRRLPDSETSVRVYPNLRDLRRYDLLVRRGLQLEAGAKRVRVPGASTEFERLRAYSTDDEFRRINWKATARRGEPIVNEYEAERSQNLVIMVDAGRLMAARANLPRTDEADAVLAAELPVPLTKLDYALNAGLLLAHVGSLRGDRVALLSYADQVRRFVPPTRGRTGFLAMVQNFYNLRAEAVEADHGAAFEFLAHRNLRRSLVVLFTDIVDRESSEVLVAHLLRAARQHVVVCVTLSDPTIARPAARVPESAQALYEKLVAQRLLDERAEVLRRLSSHGIWTVDTEADKLSPRVVSAYLELKQRGRV